jgi:hypothetical protein
MRWLPEKACGSREASTNSEATVVDEEAGAAAGAAGSVKDDAIQRKHTSYLNTKEVKFDEKKRPK